MCGCSSGGGDATLKQFYGIPCCAVQWDWGLEHFQNMVVPFLQQAMTNDEDSHVGRNSFASLLKKRTETDGRTMQVHFVSFVNLSIQRQNILEPALTWQCVN